MFDKIQLRSREVVRKSDGWGDDEIAIGGVLLAPDLQAQLIKPNAMGSYAEGERNDAPRQGAQRLAALDLSKCDRKLYPVKITDRGKAYRARVPLFDHDPGVPMLVAVEGLGTLSLRLPKVIGAVIAIAEKDSGGFAGWLGKHLRPAVARAAKAAKAALLKRLATEGVPASGASEKLGEIFAGLMRPAGALSADTVRDLAVSAWRAGGPLVGDDIGRPAFVHRVLDSQQVFASTGRDDSGDHDVEFKPAGSFDARYRLTYDWRFYR